MPPLSAIDAISPAFDRTGKELFRPFRLGFWLRMGFVALATGEFYGSSGWGGMNFTMPSRRRAGYLYLDLVRPHWEYLKRFLPWIILIGLLAVVGLLFWIYVSSVFRFVLFDSVLTDRCNIKEDWRRWRHQGMRFFLWRICLALGVTVALGVFVGAGVLAAVATGAFRNPRGHIVLLVLGGLAAFLVLLSLVFAAALIALFARDFVIPVMALENVGVIEGWRRVIAMLRVEKKSYAGYVLMKIVLVVGSAILFGILTLIAVFLLFIPISLMGVAAYLFAKTSGLLWSFPVIAIAVVLGAVIAVLMLYVIAFISAPAMVFFQAYVIHFMGSRYPTLGNRISPPPAPLTPPVQTLPDAGFAPA